MPAGPLAGDATPGRDAGRLLTLCAGYFLFYAIVTLTVKWFGRAGIKDVGFLLYQMVGGMSLSLGGVLVLRWTRFRGSLGPVQVGPLRVPSELPLVILGGFLAAVIGVTTTLMYTLPTTIMVAMVVMRGGVIVIGRVVDAIQLRRGILQKQVYWEENVACVFGLVAVALQIQWSKGGSAGGLGSIDSSAPLIILGIYLGAYAVRIYLLNYYKHTRDRAGVLDQRGFFGVEQVFTVLALVVGGLVVYYTGSSPQAATLRAAVQAPHPLWPWAIAAGLPFGIVGFYSFFLFTFRGRTATFASLVNRLTSLAAGTAATLIWQLGFDGPKTRPQDWESLAAIIVAAMFLTRAERRRAAKLAGPTGF